MLLLLLMQKQVGPTATVYRKYCCTTLPSGREILYNKYSLLRYCQFSSSSSIRFESSRVESRISSFSDSFSTIAESHFYSHNTKGCDVMRCDARRSTIHAAVSDLFLRRSSISPHLRHRIPLRSIAAFTSLRKQGSSSPPARFLLV